MEKVLIAAIIFVFVFWLGGVSHERDMVRNFEKKGDARCWFGEIKK